MQEVPEPGRLTRGFTGWHLLSLDAPTVAMLWTWFIARADRVFLPLSAVLAMGLAVWMLYAADRLLDARNAGPRANTFPMAVSAPTSVILTLTLNAVKGKGKNTRISLEPPAPPNADLQPRHYFHRRHQRGFRLGIVSASIALAFLLPGLAPQSIRLYLVLGTMLFVYFVLIHLNSEDTNHLPKEIAVGVFFSAATFIPTVARDPSLRLALVPGAVLFAVLCSLNCLFIYAWEHPAALPHTHPATAIALRFLPQLAASAAVAGLVLSLADRALPWPISLACASAAILLLLLHRGRERFSPTTLRAAADLCLLTPLLLLPFLRS